MRPMSNSYYSAKGTHEAVLPSPPATIQPRSPWHSPVPYLFGGLAAMLGLIAFALLILACAYWRLSGHLDDSEREGEQRDLESGNAKEGVTGKAEKVYEEKILVIMAGQEKPTFLATPVSGKAYSLADKTANTENREGEAAQNSNKVKEEMSEDSESTTVITTEEEENRETRVVR